MAGRLAHTALLLSSRQAKNLGVTLGWGWADRGRFPGRGAGENEEGLGWENKVGCDLWLPIAHALLSAESGTSSSLGPTTRQQPSLIDAATTATAMQRVQQNLKNYQALPRFNCTCSVCLQ